MGEKELLDPQAIARIRGKPRLMDLAYEAIRDAIGTGRIRPGDWLRREELAQELGVSQMTVRGALNRLMAEGLVSEEPYRGYKVAILPAEDLRDIYEMRGALEGIAMAEAASRIRPEELDLMRELLPQTTVSEDPQSADKARELNREFHWVAIESCGRRHLIRTLGQLWDLTYPWVLAGLITVQARLARRSLDLAQHAALLEALSQGDGQRARAIAMEHAESSLQSVAIWMHEKGIEAEKGGHQ